MTTRLEAAPIPADHALPKTRFRRPRIIRSVVPFASLVIFLIGWFVPVVGGFSAIAVAAAALGVIGFLAGGRGAALLAAWLAPVFATFAIGVYEARVAFPVAVAVYLVLYRYIARSETWLPGWFRWGRMSWRSSFVAIAIAILSVFIVMIMISLNGNSIVLLPLWIEAVPLWGLLAGCVLFASLNSALEEIVFRGIIMDALERDLGKVGALAGQATAFGAIHYELSVPSGVSGVIASGIFGLLMGVLRYRTGGFFAPLLCHFLVDLAIAAWVLSYLVR